MRGDTKPGHALHFLSSTEQIACRPLLLLVARPAAARIAAVADPKPIEDIEMHLYHRLLCVLPAILLTGGCASLNQYFNRDTLENRVPLDVGDTGPRDRHQMSVMSFTATRRAIVVNGGGPRSQGDAAGTIYACAEPPPDAVASVLSQDAYTATASRAGAKDGDPQMAATIASQYQVLAQKLAERTPLLEAYRSSLFALCQLYINGALTPDEVRDLFREINANVLTRMDPGPNPTATAQAAPAFAPTFDVQVGGKPLGQAAGTGAPSATTPPPAAPPAATKPPNAP
jgi:hypothetical protein